MLRLRCSSRSRGFRQDRRRRLRRRGRCRRLRRRGRCRRLRRRGRSRACGGAAGAGACGATGAGVADRRAAVKVAAWSTIPVSTYCVCALKSRPLEQTKSSGTHKSMVLSAYSGPTVDRRLIDRTHKPVVGFSEQGDRSDMVCHVGRHRVRHTLRCSIRYDIRGDEAHDGRALGESAEHDVGVGAVRRRRLDMSAGVPNAVHGGGEVGGGGVVDRIHLHRLRADSCAQRVHKSFSGWTETGCLGGTAREDHLDVGARLRGRGRNGCAQRRQTRYCRGTNEYGDIASPHGAMLTYVTRRRFEKPTANERRVNAPRSVSADHVISAARAAMAANGIRAGQDLGLSWIYLLAQRISRQIMLAASATPGIDGKFVVVRLRRFQSCRGTTLDLLKQGTQPVLLRRRVSSDTRIGASARFYRGTASS